MICKSRIQDDYSFFKVGMGCSHMTLKHSGLSLLGPRFSLFPSLTLPREGNLGSEIFPQESEGNGEVSKATKGPMRRRMELLLKDFWREKREEETDVGKNRDTTILYRTTLHG